MTVLRRHADGSARVYRAIFRLSDGFDVPGIVKDEKTPEAWWNEFECFYVHGASPLFANVLGHIVSGVFCPGLPPLVVCDSATPTARDVFGGGSCLAPAPGLCPVVLQDCGVSVAESRVSMCFTQRLRTAASLVNGIRDLMSRDVYITDLKLDNICVVENEVVFIDPGSIACGKAVPVTSFVLLSNWLRDLIRGLPSLESSLELFAVEHDAIDQGRCVVTPVGTVIEISAKLAVAQLFDFGDAALTFFPDIEEICGSKTNRIQVCVGHKSDDYRDFIHFFSAAQHLVE